MSGATEDERRYERILPADSGLWRYHGKRGIRCDAFGCDEWHPLEHDALGDPSFGTGRWLGWVYLDLNRPDIFPRIMRFCSTRCAMWWMDREVVTGGNYRHSRLTQDKYGPERSKLDQALRRPDDEVARTAAGLKRLTSTP